MSDNGPFDRELRVAQTLSDRAKIAPPDPDDTDPHTRAACKLFDKVLPTKHERLIAKALNVFSSYRLDDSRELFRLLRKQCPELTPLEVDELIAKYRLLYLGTTPQTVIHRPDEDGI